MDLGGIIMKTRGSYVKFTAIKQKKELAPIITSWIAQRRSFGVMAEGKGWVLFRPVAIPETVKGRTVDGYTPTYLRSDYRTTDGRDRDIISTGDFDCVSFWLNGERNTAAVTAALIPPVQAVEDNIGVRYFE